MPSTSSEAGPARSGGCACGAVRFETRGAPLWCAYCHCRDCRRHTASPVTLYAGFRADQVHLVRGRPQRRASSPGVERAFCSACGTPLSYAAPARWPGELHLFVATFDDPADFQPQGHVYFHERLAGFDVRDTLPRR